MHRLQIAWYEKKVSNFQDSPTVSCLSKPLLVSTSRSSLHLLYFELIDSGKISVRLSKVEIQQKNRKFKE